MQRAQRRDAVNSEKFFFRKDVFPPPSSRGSSISSSPIQLANPPLPDGSCSSPTSSGASTPSSTSSRTKSRRMNNCFVPPPVPEDGLPSNPVDEEYREFTVNELMNGSVRILGGLSFLFLFTLLIFVLGYFSWSDWPHGGIS